MDSPLEAQEVDRHSLLLCFSKVSLGVCSVVEESDSVIIGVCISVIGLLYKKKVLFLNNLYIIINLH